MDLGSQMQPGWNQSQPDGMLRIEGGHSESLIDMILHDLKQIVGSTRYEKWFSGRTLLSVQGDVLTVGVASPFMIQWMEREFKEVMSAIACKHLGVSAHVRFEVDLEAAELVTVKQYNQDSSSTDKQTNPEQSQVSEPLTSNRGDSNGRTTLEYKREHSRNEADQRPRKQKLAPRRRRFARLSDFVVGQCNHVSLSMARMVSQNPGEQYNPMYFYGGVGIGKTHLLEGIYSEVRSRYSELQVTYLTAEAFGNYYTNALRDKTLPAFRRRFRSIDVLLIDDIDFFDAKKGMQEEFSHTLQELLAYGRQVVLAADRHPRMLTNLRSDLLTRFLSGVVSRLESPDLQTRRDIVARKADELAFPITDDAVDYVAHKFTRNVRELIGAVNCLQTYHHLTKRKIGITATREVLKDLERDCLKIIRTGDIQSAVCDLFGVEQTDLVSARRTRNLAQPRMLAMYLSRQWTQSAYHEIGKQFGGRNHSTVMSAERRMKKMLKEEGRFKIATREWTAQEVVSMLEEQLQVG